MKQRKLFDSFYVNSELFYVAKIKYQNTKYFVADNIHLARF